MKNHNATITITEITRAKSSIYGNPSYYISGTREDGSPFYGRTASDIADAYAIGYGWEGKTAKVEYHYTKTGNCKITHCRLIKVTL